MTELATIIKVGIAEWDIVKAPNLIRTSGLGSCVGVVLYDDRQGMAGLAHIMLPDSAMAKHDPFPVGKYADTAVMELYRQMVQQGAGKYNVKAKLAGGAQMFQFQAANDMMRIGSRNINAIREQLQTLRIPIVAEDIGGTKGRTIEFDPGTMRLNIRTVHKGVIDI
ncbi:chemotaxis protein CheD [Thalassobacillus sp. CUG 92003]|uniref:chemotaxis protein CheD n=1 Tax=Thalassobacillus sp. CUG 92003 TaxID=2736641 RepID=UPI0015E650F6|nr:chemotaxis protein CheD [Thalassobacillus sp. CUG 92003]